MDLVTVSQLSAAFLVGLLGGVHCLTMCGGIVGAISFSQPQSPRSMNALLDRLPTLLAYNTGRIASYMIAGAIAGVIGATALSLTGASLAPYILQAVAGGFMIALGLYLANLWTGVAYIEKLGRGLWKRLEPLSRRFIPIRSAWQAIPVGMVWGWLPCGLVYSVLIWSFSAGSLLNGALIMLAFGLGTLPNLLLMGTVANLLTWIRKPAVKIIAGLLVSSMGLWMLMQALHPLLSR